MVKFINYNAIRTLTTPFMFKVYIILVLLGICYAFHYRNQMRGIAIKDNKNNTTEPFQSTNDKLKFLKLEQKTAALEEKLKEFQTREALQLKKLSRKIKDDKDNIKKTLYESSRDDNLENEAYMSEMSRLKKQYTDFENKKLTVYNKALTDNIEAEKKNRYNINLLNIGNNIEKGLVNIVQDLGEVIEGNINEGFASYTNRRRKAIAKISNEGKLEDWEGRDGKVGLTSNNKIEGFANTSIKTSKKNKTNKNDPLDIAKDFLEYMLTTVKDVSFNIGGKIAKDLLKVLTKDENMISSGILMLIVSVGLYFIDISS